MHTKIKSILLILFFPLFSSTFAYAHAAAPPVVQQYGAIKVLILSGDDKQMGEKYGRLLRVELHQALAILQNFYFAKGIKYEDMVRQANLLYQRFPAHYQTFMRAEAKGASLSLNDVKILNAMETLGELLSGKSEVKCALLFIPPRQTVSGAALIGRNYDYPPPFNRLAKYLTVTILNHKNAQPTAFIAIAGEVYCPTCINAKGLFMELNNGMYSGGYVIKHANRSLLTHMLDVLQHAKSLQQVEKMMKKKSADYSLIINAADKTAIESFEYSTTLGMKYFLPEKNAVFASTNHYLNPEWGMDIPPPLDEKTWLGVTRRKNLVDIANTTSLFDIASFEKEMDKSISAGGAVWDFTIYQLIFDESDLSLYVKIMADASGWTRVPLGKLFAGANNS